MDDERDLLGEPDDAWGDERGAGAAEALALGALTAADERVQLVQL